MLGLEVIPEMDNSLVALSDQLAGAVERAGAMVAAVNARPRIASSGILWQPGVIVTADHGVQRDEEIAVTLPDGRVVAATIAGRDAGTDLAVLRIEEHVEVPHTAAEPAQLKPGHVVLAIGRSLQNGASASMGVLSMVGRAWRSWRGGPIDQLLRLDVALYPGAAGGAVVDVQGRLIGLATGGLSRSGAMAVPTATIARVVEKLLTRGRVPRGFLGVGLQPVALPAGMPAERGLIVLSVETNGPAHTAGALIGDIVTGLNGQSVADTDDVQAVLESDLVGKTIPAQIVRGGQSAELKILVGERA
jgi:S1-C subfamily serine protease